MKTKNTISHKTQTQTKGVDIATPDYDGRTCLHLAASNGHTKVAEYLLKLLDISQWATEDRWGNTPEMDAIRENHSDIQLLFTKKQEEIIDTNTNVTEYISDIDNDNDNENENDNENNDNYNQNQHIGIKNNENKFDSNEEQKQDSENNTNANAGTHSSQKQQQNFSNHNSNSSSLDNKPF